MVPQFEKSKRAFAPTESMPPPSPTPASLDGLEPGDSRLPTTEVGLDAAKPALLPVVPEFDRGDLFGDGALRTGWLGLGVALALGAAAEFASFEQWLPEPQMQIVRVAAWLLGIAVLASTALMASGPLNRDASRLARMARSIKAGEFDAKLGALETRALAPAGESLHALARRVQLLLDTQRATANAIAHELRTPLARLRFSLAYLEESESAEERQRAVAGLRDDMAALDELVEASLLFAKLSRQSAQSNDLVHEQFALRPWLEKEVEGLKHLGAWVRLRLDAHAINPATIVRGDKRLLGIALRNIIRNAQKHGESVVLVTAQLVGDMVQIDVDDDGNGIPEADRERVFEPFVRLDLNRPRAENETGGTGLGLAITKRIATLHAGNAEAIDSPMTGARVRLSFRV
jgi:signal transduction histidine kinase